MTASQASAIPKHAAYHTILVTPSNHQKAKLHDSGKAKYIKALINRRRVLFHYQNYFFDIQLAMSHKIKP